MIGLRRFVGASVARRLFVLFILCAFLPLAAIALLSLSQVRTLLLQQGDQRLAASAKSYGMSVFERVLMASDLASAAASRAQARLAPDALAVRTFDALVLVGAQPRVLLGDATLPSLPAEVRQRVKEGKSAVVVVPGQPAPAVWIAAPAASDPEMAVALLRRDYLWGPSDELPAATEFCVVEDQSRVILHCPSAMSPAAMRRLAVPTMSSMGAASWERDGEIYRSRAWTQFMRAGLGTPDWIVIASQPEEFHLARVLEFRNIYIPVVLLALLLVTWFTIRQSRNIVDPVARLAARARGVARQDFATRLDLKRDDEFGELGAAFDQMSQRLGRQFASLTALSEIDRLILGTQDTAQVVRAVLHRMGDVLRADMLAITLFDNDNPDHARTYFRPFEAADTMSMERHDATSAERQALAAAPSGAFVSLVDLSVPAPGYLAPLRAQEMASAYVHPIVWRGDVCGALVLGFRGPAPALGEDDRQQARELADRVAVAVSSAWRDEQLYRQAHYDALTRLPNRLLFNDRLEREVARSQRESLTFAVLFVDLDHFKHVNDSFGHGMGDEVLREAARRVSSCIRETDTVSRLGGDEFTLIITRLSNPQEAWLIAETVVDKLSREFTFGERQCFLSASIGIASYPADGQTAEQLLRAADTAMYRAKAAGRSQTVFFEERMNAEALARVTLDRDLRAAIERDELELHYQPKFDLRTGEISGAEALIRWNHPLHGLISPLRFIPLAEESGFIDHVGRWTIERACAQMKDWRAEGLAMGHVSVNVSPRQFRKRTLVDFIRRCVSEAGLPPSCLQIEITEGLLLDRGEAVESLLYELSAMGHGIALDDFGTGFSSMSYLKRLPVDVIKIDRVFVDGLDKGPDSEPMVAAIIAMSHALGKTVVAEGVETAEQLAVLRRLRCDEIQGFFIGAGLPADQFVALLRARRTIPA